MTSARPRVVSKFEGKLLTIVRAAVRLSPVDAALPALFDRPAPPPGLSTTCLELVCDSLAKGCVLYLARAGGWRRERFLRGGVPVVGRLWDRTPLDERKLVFSENTLDFFRWLTASDPTQTKPWQPEPSDLTVADQLVIALTYDAFRDSEAGLAWRERPAFARNPLVRLTYAEDFAAAARLAPDYSAWVDGLGGAILEALQALLAARWLTVERGKRGIGDWPTMVQLGDAQALVLDRFAAAVEPPGRYDLARFLLHAAVRSCPPSARAEDLVGGLQGGKRRRLAERYAVQRRAGALLQFLERMGGWERRARGVGYLDEGYAAAQSFLADWESAGAADAAVRAREVLRQLEPIRIESEGDGDEPSVSHPRQ
jgi:hypothetical protein